MAPLTKTRVLAASAVLSGTIFAIGGQAGSKALDSVECYVPAVNMWVPVSAMNVGRSAPQAGVANNILYVYGGWNDNILSGLNTLERYDAKENTWTLVILLLYFLSCTHSKIYLFIYHVFVNFS